MRAHEPQRIPDDDVPPLTTPLLTLRAGDTLLVRIAAVDRQSGVAEIVARCRSRENHELTSSGRWVAPVSGTAPADHYYPVEVAIPSNSPGVIWELHQIVLCDGEGNRRTYHAGRDFQEMSFRVLERRGVDCTPPRLLGVQFGRTGPAFRSPSPASSRGSRSS
jgi:hypothetical protein